jgi:hypothetical protein
MKQNLFMNKDQTVMINFDNVESATSLISGDNLVMVYFVSGANFQLKGFDARIFLDAWRKRHDQQQDAGE